MHIMLDLETMGTKPGSVIRSIGAVGFELGAPSQPAGAYLEYYANITRESCIDAGLTEDSATVEWWSRQSAEAKDIFADNPVSLPEALSVFYSWFKAVGGKQVWSQGAAFDVVLAEFAFKAASMPPVPWKFWDVHDTRTVYEIAGFDHHAAVRGGIAHYALDDCKHQIKCVLESLRMLGR